MRGEASRRAGGGRAGAAPRARVHGEPTPGEVLDHRRKTWDSVVFIKSPSSERHAEGHGKAYAQASLGVVTLPAGTTASTDQAGFVSAAQNFLSDRFRGLPRVSLMDLKTTPYSLNGALCAKFEAVQVERYTARRNLATRLEFLNRGFLCRHPENRTVVVHGFFNKTYRRLSPTLLDAETEKEADRFLESVVLSPLE